MLWSPARRPARARNRTGVLSALAVCAALLAPGSAIAASAPIDTGFRGTVVDLATHQPVAGGLVEAVSGGVVLASTRTGPAGDYALTAVPPRSDYLLRAGGPGHEARLSQPRFRDLWSPTRFVVGFGTVYPIDFELPALDARIQGRVVDRAGHPLPGVVVRRYLGWSTPGPGPLVIPDYRAETDGNGRYEIAVPSGGLGLLAERPDLVRVWTGNTMHPADGEGIDLQPGETRTIDFRMDVRPPRSCWAAGGYWIAGTTDRPAPSFPPDGGDYCTGALAPTSILTVADAGETLVGGQHMDFGEVTMAFLVPEASGGIVPPAVRLVAGSANRVAPAPAGLAPAPHPAVAVGSLTGTSRLRVRSGRFVATTRCPKSATCTGTLRAVVTRRSRDTTVASAPIRRGTGVRRTTLRLTGSGRRLLRTGHGRLRVSLRWEVPGRPVDVARTVRLESR